MRGNNIDDIEQMENGTMSDKIIELRSINKEVEVWIEPAWDGTTSWWAGIANLSEEEKKGRPHYVKMSSDPKEAVHNAKIKASHGHIFDLSKAMDRLNWAWVKHSPEVAMSLDEAQSSKASFYVHIEGIEASKSNKLVELNHEARGRIIADPTSNYVNRALLLGLDMSKESPEVIKEYLFSVADETPKKILHIYRDKSMKINLLYLKAKRDGKITEDDSGVLRFSKFVLGTNEGAAVAFLVANEDVLELLEMEADPGYYKEPIKATPVTANVIEGGIEPSYAYMKAHAIGMGYTGSMKKLDVAGYLSEMGVSLEELREEEDETIK